MTQAKRPPSVLAFFGSELRRLRSAAGLSQEELGQRISYSGSLVGLIETARRAPSKDLAARCDELLNAGGILTRLWPLVSQEGLPRWFQQYAELEQIATSLRLWEPLIIPGLLQTPEYAQELISAWQAADGKETTAEQVEARVQRQEVLNREHPPLCWAVIDLIRSVAFRPMTLAC